MKKRKNPLRVANTKWVEAVELFHTLYIPEGPYRSNVPRLVGEIVERLEGDEALRTALLSEFGKRGASVRAANKQASLSPATQLMLWEEHT